MSDCEIKQLAAMIVAATKRADGEAAIKEMMQRAQLAGVLAEVVDIVYAEAVGGDV